jgi:hypothetical protein
VPQAIKQRIKELRDEIAEISEANRQYIATKEPGYTKGVAEQERRLLRLQEILDELQSLNDWKKP